MAFRVLYFSCDARRSAAVPRYEMKGNHYCRCSIMLCGQKPDEAAKTKEVEVPKKEVENLMTSLEKTGFWKMRKYEREPVPDPQSHQDNTGTHGTSVIVEAIKNGQYRVRTRLGPSYKTDQRGLSPLVRWYAGVFQDAGLWKKARTLNGRPTP